MNRKVKTIIASAVAAVAMPLTMASACSPSSTTNAAATSSSDIGVEQTMDNNQPAPVFSHSDIREDGIMIEAIEALGENTTTFAIANNGTLIWSCPSIGEPFHADDSITNPDQIDNDTNPGKPNSTAVVIGNMDPNGIYPGPNTGTYELYLSANGVPYAHYAEENLDVVSAPARWDPNGANHVIVTGAPSMPVCTVEPEQVTANGKTTTQNETVCTK